MAIPTATLTVAGNCDLCILGETSVGLAPLEPGMSLSISSRERAIAEQYGLLLSFSDVVKALRYPSLHAARKAMLRGTFPIEMKKLPLRRGLFATARQLAEYLDSLDSKSTEPRES